MNNDSNSPTESSSVLESIEKLNVVAKSLQPWVDDDSAISKPRSIRCRPCTCEEDTKGYRAKGSFQIVSHQAARHPDNQNGLLPPPLLAYAVRKDQKPVMVPEDEFPVFANRRIQIAMKHLLAILNSGEVPHLRSSHDALASVTFSSSWNCDCWEAEDANQYDKKMNNSNTVLCDCLVTMNYQVPIENVKEWQNEARRVCEKISLNQITGRSKKCVVRAKEPENVLIRDTIWLVKKKNDELSTAGGATNDCWTVQLTPPERVAGASSAVTVAGGGAVAAAASMSIIPVRYEKPEGAFFHPNARAMCAALSWMLNRLSQICSEHQNKTKKVRLVELYCGCGAHTAALAKSGLVERIEAVELDERLVQACRSNCLLNQVQTVTPVTVVASDAAQWAKKKKKEKEKNQEARTTKTGEENQRFVDVLLVDPPRQGLDETVCDMARSDNSFEHLLYISCGRDALVRDLGCLSPDFRVEDCTLLDLFPGTLSVESLVHLVRRRRPKQAEQSRTKNKQPTKA